jgi:outer membrane protein TolC
LISTLKIFILENMIIKQVILWGFSVLISLPSYAQPKAVKLNLNETIALALRRNISVRNAYLTRINTKFSYWVAQDNYNPQYSLSTTASYDSGVSVNNRIDTRNRNVAAGVSLNLPSGGALALTALQNVSFVTNSKRSHAGSLQLLYRQPLLRGFGQEIATANLTMAGYSDLSSQLSLKSKLINTVTAVISQYRRYMLSLRSLKIAESALKRAKESVITVSELIKAGRLARVDLVQSETSLANKKLSLRNAQNQAKMERYGLLNLLDIGSPIPLELTEKLYIKPLNLDLKKLIAIAKANQPSYLQTKITLDIAELSRKVARDKQRWDLELTSRYTLSGSGERLTRSIKETTRIGDAGYAVDLTLTIPIDDISREQALLNNKISWLKARNNFISSNKALRLTLLSAKQSIESAWDNINLAKRSLALSKRQLALEQEKQRAGKSTHFQILAYQDDLVKAENASVAAQITYLNALTSLDQTLGTTLQHWGVKVVAESKLQPTDINAFSTEKIKSK